MQTIEHSLMRYMTQWNKRANVSTLCVQSKLPRVTAQMDLIRLISPFRLIAFHSPFMRLRSYAESTFCNRVARTLLRGLGL